MVLRTWANAQDSLRSYSLDFNSRRVSVLSAVAFFRHDFTSVLEVKVSGSAFSVSIHDLLRKPLLQVVGVVNWSPFTFCFIQR